MLHVLPAIPGVRARVVPGAPYKLHMPTAPRLEERHANFMRGLTLSQPQHLIRPADTALSGLFHLVLFFLAIQAATATAEVIQTVRVEEDLVFFTPAVQGVRKAPEPVRAETKRPGPGGGGGTKGVAVTRGFQTVAVVRSVTSEIPPVSASDATFDARNYSGFGEEGGVADGVKGGIKVTEVPPVLAGELPVEGDGTGGGRVVEVSNVTVVAKLLKMPPVEYPSMLRKVGVQGYVHLRFIIDTLGMVEPGSVRAIDSEYRPFEDAVRRSLLKAKFTPARIGEEKVRQLTEQRFNFRLDNQEG